MIKCEHETDYTFQRLQWLASSSCISKLYCNVIILILLDIILPLVICSTVRTINSTPGMNFIFAQNMLLFINMPTKYLHLTSVQKWKRSFQKAIPEIRSIAWTVNSGIFFLTWASEGAYLWKIKYHKTSFQFCFKL